MPTQAGFLADADAAAAADLDGSEFDEADLLGSLDALGDAGGDDEAEALLVLEGAAPPTRPTPLPTSRQPRWSSLPAAAVAAAHPPFAHEAALEEAAASADAEFDEEAELLLLLEASSPVEPQLPHPSPHLAASSGTRLSPSEEDLDALAAVERAAAEAELQEDIESELAAELDGEDYFEVYRPADDALDGERDAEFDDELEVFGEELLDSEMEEGELGGELDADADFNAAQAEAEADAADADGEDADDEDDEGVDADAQAEIDAAGSAAAETWAFGDVEHLVAQAMAETDPDLDAEIDYGMDEDAWEQASSGSAAPAGGLPARVVPAHSHARRSLREGEEDLFADAYGDDADAAEEARARLESDGEAPLYPHVAEYESFDDDFGDDGFGESHFDESIDDDDDSHADAALRALYEIDAGVELASPHRHAANYFESDALDGGDALALELEADLADGEGLDHDGFAEEILAVAGASGGDGMLDGLDGAYFQ